jgi:DNA recombination protein RmuC
LNQTISQEAKNLTEALKGQSKTQGNWGEMILENILEKSGLVKGREYTVQESVKDIEGKRFQPDVIISYPDNRKVVIDSKVSLVAYERYSSSTNKEDQEKSLIEHLRSVKNHIDSLSSKNYQDLVGSLDSVMMFIPVEPAYMVVMEADSDLWNYAYSKRVLLISPTNLIAALKLIYNLWQHEFQNRNALEIANRGGLLYDKFVGFVENLKSIGESIHKAHSSYESAFSQLKEGKGNLISQAQQLKELGVKAKKSISSELIDSNDVNELNHQVGLPPND